jgi:hypothetical protein
MNSLQMGASLGYLLGVGGGIQTDLNNEKTYGYAELGFSTPNVSAGPKFSSEVPSAGFQVALSFESPSFRGVTGSFDLSWNASQFLKSGQGNQFDFNWGSGVGRSARPSASLMMRGTFDTSMIPGSIQDVWKNPGTNWQNDADRFMKDFKNSFSSMNWGMPPQSMPPSTLAPSDWSAMGLDKCAMCMNFPANPF